MDFESFSTIKIWSRPMLKRIKKLKVYDSIHSYSATQRQVLARNWQRSVGPVEMNGGYAEECVFAMERLDKFEINLLRKKLLSGPRDRAF